MPAVFDDVVIRVSKVEGTPPEVFRWSFDRRFGGNDLGGPSELSFA